MVLWPSGCDSGRGIDSGMMKFIDRVKNNAIEWRCCLVLALFCLMLV